MTKKVSPDWVHLIEKALLQTQQLPPLEEHLPFPWSEASHSLATALSLPNLSLSPIQALWRNSEQILNGMGERAVVFSIEMAPVEGHLFFAMSRQSVAYLTAAALLPGEHKEGFSNTKLQEGFYTFLLLKALQSLDHLKLFEQVSFHLSTAAQLPSESSFCIDLSCALPEKSLQARVICPSSFLTALKAYQPFQQNTLLSSPVTRSIETLLRSEIGTTALSTEEWTNLKVGDFIVLDQCSYDPIEGKGSVTLFLGKTPLLRARLKSEGMKILDYVLRKEETFEDSSANPETFSAQAPIHLTVEAGCICLPLLQLLHLEPGMMLDITLNPKQGVEITLEGKRVAQGELLKLGETVGLRILDLTR